LKLFYLAADSVAEATSAVVLADSFVKPTGADKHQEERKKTGSYLICIAIQWGVKINLLNYDGCIGEMQHKIEKMQEELMKVQLKYQKVYTDIII